MPSFSFSMGLNYLFSKSPLCQSYVSLKPILSCAFGYFLFCPELRESRDSACQKFEFPRLRLLHFLGEEFSKNIHSKSKIKFQQTYSLSLSFSSTFSCSGIVDSSDFLTLHSADGSGDFVSVETLASSSFGLFSDCSTDS